MFKLKLKVFTFIYKNNGTIRNEEDKHKLDAIQRAETQTMLEKAKEIEKLKQECEYCRSEKQKFRQKMASIEDKNKYFEGWFILGLRFMQIHV